MISTIAIPTADRPQELERSLSSLFSLDYSNFGQPRILIVDGSHSSLLEDKSRKIVYELMRTRKHKTSFCGQQEKKDFLEKLASTNCADPGLLQYSLNSKESEAYGSNRNLILLLTPGEKVLSVDDDIHIARCGAVELSENASVSIVDHLASEISWWFHADRVSALEVISHMPRCPIAQHDDLLGFEFNYRSRLSPHPWAEHGAEIKVGPTTTYHVALTMSGLAGDCASRTRGALSLLPMGDSRDRLLINMRHYFEATLSRELVRHVRQPTAALRADVLTACFALNNSVPLPPFVPFGRGEDLVFGHMLELFYPSYAFGSVPSAVAHNPQGIRSYSGELSALYMSHAFVACLRTVRRSLPIESVSLQTQGKALVQLCTSSIDDFSTTLCSSIEVHIVGLIERLAELLRAAAYEPSWWADSLSAQIAECERKLDSMASMLPQDIKGQTAKDILVSTRDRVLQFGNLLVAWPDIVESAQYLIDRNQLHWLAH